MILKFLPWCTVKNHLDVPVRQGAYLGVPVRQGSVESPSRTGTRRFDPWRTGTSRLRRITFVYRSGDDDRSVRLRSVRSNAASTKESNMDTSKETMPGRTSSTSTGRTPSSERALRRAVDACFYPESARVDGPSRAFVRHGRNFYPMLTA